MKKGFTLIELIGVVIILAIISVLVYPSILKQINATKNELSDSMKEIIYTATDLYASNSRLEKTNGFVYCVTIRQLVDKDYLNSNLVDPVTKKNINQDDYVKITVFNSNYQYEITDSCTGIKDTVPPTVAFTVADGTLNESGWANKAFNVGIIINDDNSGGSHYKYCIDTKSCTPTVDVNDDIGFAEISNNSETNKVCVIGYDSVGNASDTICSDSYKLDSVMPTLTTITDDITINEGDSNLVSSYFNTPSYGISGGSLSCNPENTSDLIAGTQSVSCTATSNSGLVKTTNKDITVNASYYSSAKGINKPQLLEGMTPIKWVEGVETETTVDDPDWYDYSNKLWANAKTEDGSYWVWIPRYAYKISSGWHTATAGTIDIIFLKNDTTENSSGTTIQTSGYSITGINTSNAYFLEPAFQNETGNTKYGFWVAKFKASVSDTSDACYTCDSEGDDSECPDNCNLTTLTPKFVPNVSSWRYINISNQYTVAQDMASNNTYGWSSSEADTHMMTNYEWGAVAYLSLSNYGKNSEVWINNSSTFTTGCSGDSVSASEYSGCQNAYNTVTGMNASTTGNITGIYDMSGGAAEYTAAYINNSNASDCGSSIVDATKNKNVYNVGTSDTEELNYAANANMYGDAVYETSSSYPGSTSWNTDASDMPHSLYPWFYRGGYYFNTSIAGLFFISSDTGISTHSIISFRGVVSRVQ